MQATNPPEENHMTAKQNDLVHVVESVRIYAADDPQTSVLARLQRNLNPDGGSSDVWTFDMSPLGQVLAPIVAVDEAERDEKARALIAAVKERDLGNAKAQENYHAAIAALNGAKA